MEPMLGQLLLFTGTYAPRNWADCNGQLVSISQSTSLFSLIGTNYGGDGRSTFGLPNLQGRVVVGYGTGPGLTPRNMGDYGGAEHVTLQTNQMPSHTHAAASNLTASGTLSASNNTNDSSSAGADIFLGTGGTMPAIYREELENAANVAGLNITVSGNVEIGATGASQGHENMPPFQVARYIIAMDGYYPPRS